MNSLPPRAWTRTRSASLTTIVGLCALAFLTASALAAPKKKPTKRDWFRFPQRVELQTVTHLVLDPGHGGDNHGAVGYWGTREKALTLSIARYMRDYIEANSNVRVTLTRHADRAIGLRERPRLANKVAPQAFISLHCNANERREAHGMEVWFLSADSSKAVIHDLVRREEGLPISPHSSAAPWSVDAIVSEMAYSMAHQRSSDLAHALGSGMHWGRPTAKFRGVKQAAFGVLKEARMPAVVLEVGFISNPREGKELLDPKTHLQLARGVLRGLLLFDRKQVASSPTWMKRTRLAKKRSGSLPGGPTATAKTPR